MFRVQAMNSAGLGQPSVPTDPVLLEDKPGRVTQGGPGCTEGGPVVQEELTEGLWCRRSSGGRWEKPVDTAEGLEPLGSGPPTRHSTYPPLHLPTASQPSG